MEYESLPLSLEFLASLLYGQCCGPLISGVRRSAIGVGECAIASSAQNGK